MSPKIFEILQDCIERGIEIGLHRSFKHTETPSRETQAQCIEDAVMGEIHRFFEFEIKEEW